MLKEKHKKSSKELKKEFDELTNKLYEGVIDYLNSDKYQEILNNISKFHKYSVNNTILIMLQRPENCSYVASFTDWKKKFFRSVNAGEKGIQIYIPTTYKAQVEVDKLDAVTREPIRDEEGNVVKEIKEIERQGFKIGYTYDISQTSQIEGKPVIDIQITKELEGSVDNSYLLRAIKNASPVPVVHEDINGMAKGYFSDDKQIIAIKNGLSEKQETKTLLHEITHSIVDNSKVDELKKELKIEQTDELRRAESEIIAESTAYLISKHYGIETDDYSFPYVASWASEDPKLILAQLDTIKKASNEIIKRIDIELEKLYEAEEIRIEYTPEVYYAYIYDGNGMHGDKIAIEADAKNVANFIIENSDRRVIITDTVDNFIVSSELGFLDRVYSPEFREELLKAILPLQLQEKNVEAIRYVVETPELEELAMKLDAFSKDYDYYSYQDAEEYPNSNYDTTLHSLKKGGAELEGIKSYLKEVKEEGEQKEFVREASILLLMIDKFEQARSMEIEPMNMKHKMRMA